MKQSIRESRPTSREGCLELGRGHIEAGPIVLEGGKLLMPRYIKHRVIRGI
jgi:hypothetical protein